MEFVEQEEYRGTRGFNDAILTEIAGLMGTCCILLVEEIC